MKFLNRRKYIDPFGEARSPRVTQPSPSLTPLGVIEAQLEALERGDVPESGLADGRVAACGRKQTKK